MEGKVLTHKKVYSASDLCKLVAELGIAREDIQHISFGNDTYTIFYWK